MSGGWVVVTGSQDGETTIDRAWNLAEVVAREDLQFVVIDVPIGLPARGPRACDLEARAMLGSPRSSSVFPAPIRPMLAARTYEEASGIRFQIEGKRISRQSFAIQSTIREADNLMTPVLQDRVVEGHPEVSFAAMAGAGIAAPKRTPRGRQIRTELLSQHVPDLRLRIGELQAAIQGDAIDASALLWSARRLADGTAERLGDAARDDHGLRMEMVY
jgi:predicted RNase H-like nuclease